MGGTVYTLLFHYRRRSIGRVSGVRTVRLFVGITRLRDFSHTTSFFTLPGKDISHRVRTLRRRLNARLLRHAAQQIGLAPRNVACCRQTGSILDGLDRLSNLFRRSTADVDNGLHVSVPPKVTGDLLLPHLSRFLCLRPKVRLRLDDRSHPMSVLRSNFSYIVHANTLPRSNIVTHPLNGLAVIGYTDPRCLAHFNCPRDPSSLASRTVIHCAPRLNMRPLNFRITDIGNIR